MPDADVRVARPDELEMLPALERAADQLFATVGISPVFEPATVAEYAAAAVVLVAGDPPVGSARLSGLDGTAYLQQLSVHPDRARRGIGRALLEAACGWAVGQGYRAVTLITYRDIAWNGPFYASAGFVPLDELGAGLAAEWRHDQADRPARYGARVAMVRHLGPAG